MTKIMQLQFQAVSNTKSEHFSNLENTIKMQVSSRISSPHKPCFLIFFNVLYHLIYIQSTKKWSGATWNPLDDHVWPWGHTLSITGLSHQWSCVLTVCLSSVESPIIHTHFITAVFKPVAQKQTKLSLYFICWEQNLELQSDQIWLNVNRIT